MVMENEIFVGRDHQGMVDLVQINKESKLEKDL